MFERESMGGAHLEPIPLVHTLNQVQEARQRAINAYRRNMALPDVHVIDRHDNTPPPVVGEDGQELTPERRAQLMAEAGVKPMFDPQGEPTGQVYSHSFDSCIEPERLGESAINNRRDSILIVSPKELELLGDVGEETIASAQSGTYIPGAEGSDKGASLRIFESFPVHDYSTLMGAWALASAAITTEFRGRSVGPKRIALSTEAREYLQRLAGPGSLIRFDEDDLTGTCKPCFGCIVQINEALGLELRVYGDPEVQRGAFASIYLQPEEDSDE